MNKAYLTIYVVNDSNGNVWVYANETDAMRAFQSYVERVVKSYSKHMKIKYDVIGGTHLYVYDLEHPDKGFIFEVWMHKAENKQIVFECDQPVGFNTLGRNVGIKIF